MAIPVQFGNPYPRALPQCKYLESRHLLLVVARWDPQQLVAAFFQQTLPAQAVGRTSPRPFIANREAEGRPLPRFIVDEFEAFLKCGIPAFGFPRLKCNSCGDEKIVAFDCTS